MKLKTLIISILIVTGSMTTVANADDMADLYFSKDNPKLTKQEKSAMAIAQKWKATSATGIPPSPGANGTIQFVYGVQQPSIVCAVLQVCDVALQPGELVNSIHLGDTARWTIDPAITGSGNNEVQHLVIKPMDVGLETSLDVFTNLRAYHIQLRSHRTQYMPKVAFTYPEDSLAKWEAFKKRETKDREEKTIPKTGEYLGDLNFDYEITSDSDVGWKPVRVYNDGQKTIIQMPPSMSQTEAPTLLIVRKEGGVFTDDETEIVNYRVQGDRYIVDSIFNRAILIAGVGGDQDSVTIQKGGK
jgi:type IV secretion system protein VirB9